MSLLPRLTWRRPGGLPECPYFRLTQVEWFGYAIAIHEWMGDDDHEAMHDHGQWFITCILRGGYTDHSHDIATDTLTIEKLRPFQIKYRPATFMHQVLHVLPGTVTLLLKGRPSRRWGFRVNGKLIKRDRYFVEAGHHGCTPDGPRVRRRPDGSRVV